MVGGLCVGDGRWRRMDGGGGLQQRDGRKEVVGSLGVGVLSRTIIYYIAINASEFLGGGGIISHHNLLYCRLSHPPPLAGGVKIRASEFLGGGGTPSIIVISPPPATASRSHPPPQAAEGKNSFLSKKEFPFPRKRESPYPLIVKNDAVRALLAPANREIPAFAGMEGEGGNGRGRRE